MARKAAKRKRRGIPWTGFFLIAAPIALVGFLFLPLKISQLPFAQAQWKAWEKLGIRAEKITVTPRGKVRAYKVAMGSPEACRIGEMRLELSVFALLRGRIVLRQAEGRSIWVDWRRLPPFLERVQKEMPARLARRVTGFGFSGRDIRIEGLWPGAALAVEKATLDLRLRPVPVAKVRAGGLRVGDWPLQSLSFTYKGRPAAFALEKLEAEWPDVSAKGRVMVDSGRASGAFEFEVADLEAAMKPRLDSTRVVEGRLQGALAFRADLQRKSLEASGRAEGKLLRLKGLPAQEDPLVRNYMPALQDVRFREMRVERFDWREGRLTLDSIQAHGSPLSLSGRGRIGISGNLLPGPGQPLPQGQVALDLVGRLEEEYFTTLKPLVKTVMDREDDGRRAFKFQIRGDFQRQRVIPEKVFSRLFKSFVGRFGRKARVTAEAEPVVE